MSPLGVGVALFLVCGTIYVLIGALTSVFVDSGTSILFVSSRSDAIVFKGQPSDLLRDDPQLALLRSLLLKVVGGLLLCAGILVIGVTWNALRAGEPWALVVLTLAGGSVLPFWFLVLRPYMAAGAPLTLSDLPPFMWIPSALYVPAVVASWLGLRQ